MGTVQVQSRCTPGAEQVQSRCTAGAQQVQSRCTAGEAILGLSTSGMLSQVFCFLLNVLFRSIQLPHFLLPAAVPTPGHMEPCLERGNGWNPRLHVLLSSYLPLFTSASSGPGGHQPKASLLDLCNLLLGPRDTDWVVSLPTNVLPSSITRMQARDCRVSLCAFTSILH